MRSSRTSRAVMAAGTLTLALALTACGGDDDSMGGAMSSGTMSERASASPASADHDQADVMFSTMMVPHHQQAVEMADLVPDRSQKPAVLALAQRIKAEQQPEIDTMSGWLKEWGVALPDAMGDHAGDMGMSGMMSDADMSSLEGLKGTEFDRRWLEMMVAHHQGAITMAQGVLRSGTHAGTDELATAIVAAQQKEIIEMQRMLAG